MAVETYDGLIILVNIHGRSTIISLPRRLLGRIVRDVDFFSVIKPTNRAKSPHPLKPCRSWQLRAESLEPPLAPLRRAFAIEVVLTDIQRERYSFETLVHQQRPTSLEPECQMKTMMRWRKYGLSSSLSTLTDMISDSKPRSGSRLAKSSMRRHSN